MPDDVLRAGAPVPLPHQGIAGQLWGALMDIADVKPDGWTLVGAMMVILHELEAGGDSSRATADADAVVEVRGVTGGTRAMAQLLVSLGWRIHDEDIDVHGHGYTFRTGQVAFDLIAPEGLGPRTDLTTVPPLTAPTLPATRQALDRTQHVAVQLAGRRSVVPRPDLLGALVIKSCAATADRTRAAQRHRDDLARLYALIPVPAELADVATRKDRRRLRVAPEPTWEILADPLARASGQAAHRLLTARGDDAATS